MKALLRNEKFRYVCFLVLSSVVAIAIAGLGEVAQYLTVLILLITHFPSSLLAPVAGIVFNASYDCVYNPVRTCEYVGTLNEEVFTYIAPVFIYFVMIAINLYFFQFVKKTFKKYFWSYFKEL